MWSAERDFLCRQAQEEREQAEMWLESRKISGLTRACRLTLRTMHARASWPRQRWFGLVTITA